MSDDALRRTVRRCTAVLILPLAGLLFAAVRSLAVRGVADRSRPLLVALTAALFVAAGGYLFASAARSLGEASA